MPRLNKVERLSTDVLTELEGDWRAGLLSIRVIAAKYRVDPDALRNFAIRAGWTRGDLHDAIRASSNRALVEQTVAEDHHSLEPVVSTAEETVERYGQLAADIVNSHRHDAARGRLHANRLERELYRLVGAFGDSVQDPKERLSLIRSSAETLRCLAITTKMYIEVERQAWGLDKPGGESAGYDELLEELLSARKIKSAS